MKKLNNNEVVEFGKNFSKMPLADVKKIAEIFYSLKEKNDYRLKNTELDTVKDYVDEYCNSWYRYDDFEGLAESEKEQGPYGFDEKECRAQIGKSIFRLESGTYIQCVY